MTTRLEFLEGQLIASSIHAAFQRGNIYSSAKDSQRLDLRERLGTLLRGYKDQYKKPVSDESHVKNIQTIANALTTEFGTFLCNGKFRIGQVARPKVLTHH
jgi:hypothetical protein